MKLEYKGTELKGRGYDRVMTPWGGTLKFYDEGWVAYDWLGLSHDELTKGADITPEGAGATEPAVRPTTLDTVRDCISCMKSDNAWIRQSALDLLPRIGPDGSNAVATLADLLEKSRRGAVGMSAPSLIIETIGRIGPGAIDAVPVLLTFREHTDPNVRSALVWALLRVAPRNETTADYLRKSTKDSAEGVQCAADSALRDLLKEQN